MCSSLHLPARVSVYTPKNPIIHRHVTDYNLTSEREILMYGTNLLKETPSDRKHFVPKAQRIYAALGPHSRFRRSARMRRSTLRCVKLKRTYAVLVLN
ncbi:hypothetical protein AVEN_269845-1 [Araneus ventricosus]|uniref:Uncharacterized protein n=1 Tax=Araneus ventricosus TaxID=182803 RepID=A0A4Y2CG46_ARAVE|nr:hypothetical protein AVEN_269845-1 [Araneus ventricosus]